MISNSIDAFVNRWQAADGKEIANPQPFLAELCDLLGVERPRPASHDPAENIYAFERTVTFHNGDGTESTGRIDLYKQGCFVLESKSLRQTPESPGWKGRMLRAHGQASQYVRALPPDEGRPPFILLLDVGQSVIEIHSEFSRTGGAYVPFPDPRSHRLTLGDLRDEAIRERLSKVWTDPLSLDPSRRSAKVTKEIARLLGELAEQLEEHGKDPDEVASFLKRCLFTMFAEDTKLLPEHSFTDLLEQAAGYPQHFPRLLSGLWGEMDRGGFSVLLRADILRFNGGLFAEHDAIALTKEQILLLQLATEQDWREVEPAIFGTLLQRALDPVERHQLGAHYTPRAYVERLVMPTVIEPLRDEWKYAHAAAIELDRQGKHDEALTELRHFRDRLVHVRVLDPACGSGNFLYVTLEHLKRLEGEVLNTIAEFGSSQEHLEMAGVTVDPRQMLGIEKNPRAARIAEAVLWIGYLQWHFRTRGDVNPPQPVLKNYKNIEHRDALLDWDKVEYVTDERGIPKTRWDGKTMKTHPVTGERVPDESAQAVEERYVNPRKAAWPEADFVVGNPPFIGTSNLRRSLGDGYTDAVRQTYKQVPESADYVMYWWHIAAGLACEAKIKRFGLITTNSLRQTFNRRVVQHHMGQKKPLSLVFAVPDHPWVDTADGADVRIAMTVGEGGEHVGELANVIEETDGQGEGVDVALNTREGKLHSDLRAGVDTTACHKLSAHDLISSPGVKLHGAGFIVTPQEAAKLGLGQTRGLERHIRHYRNGRDLTQIPRGVMVIDLQGLSADEVRALYPDVYQRVRERVKPERDNNLEAYRRDNWWVFGRKHTELRLALAKLHRYISTVETSKHRFFIFLDESILPDNKLINICLEGSFHLGVLSSRIHVTWSLVTGSRLGVGNDPVYVKTRCFETYPFPDPTETQRQQIRDLAEQLDTRRKHRQQLHPKLTLTGIYNVLEKLRSGEELTDADKLIHEQGLVTVIGELHDELDTAALDAYGWGDLAPALVGKPGGTTPSAHKSPAQIAAEEDLLGRLVKLNAERAAEEEQGLVRWLRPEFQAPEQPAATQKDLIPGLVLDETVAAMTAKKSWPKSLTEQFKALKTALAEHPAPLGAEQLARTFKRAQTRRVSELLTTLVALGQARSVEGGRFTSVRGPPARPIFSLLLTARCVDVAHVSRHAASPEWRHNRGRKSMLHSRTDLTPPFTSKTLHALRNHHNRSSR